MESVQSELRSLRMIASDDAWCCCTWEETFILVWWGAATMSRATEAADEMRAFAASHPGGIALFTVVTHGATPPDSHVRPVFSRAMRDASDRIRGSAYYVPIAGFKGAAVRSVITGLSLLAAESFPTTCHADLERAAAWSQGRLFDREAASARAARLCRLVERLLDRQLSRAA